MKNLTQQYPSSIVNAVMSGERIALVHGVNANVREEIIYPLIKEALNLGLSVLVIAPSVRVLRQIESASDDVNTGVLSVINALDKEAMKLRSSDYALYHVVIIVDAHCVSRGHLHDIGDLRHGRILLTGLAIGGLPWVRFCDGKGFEEIHLPTPCEKLKATYGENSPNYRSLALAEWQRSCNY